MPVEPDNRKVEELLKAYARKRREEAGTDFELHPATRKLLQSEVARQYGRRGAGKRNFFSSLVRFWPRIAFAGAAVVILSLVLWNVTRQPNRTSAAYEMAQAQRKDSPAATTLSQKG